MWNLEGPFQIHFRLLYVGVRQGDKLSPSLLKIYINDFPTFLDSRIHVYIDEVSLQAQTVNLINVGRWHCYFIILAQINGYKEDFLNLHGKYCMLCKYCSDWCLNINIQKTKVMIFNKAGRNITQKLMFQNNTIDCIWKFSWSFNSWSKIRAP